MGLATNRERIEAITDKVVAIQNASIDPLNPARHDEVLTLQLDLLAFAISSGTRTPRRSKLAIGSTGPSGRTARRRCRSFT